MRLLKDIEKLLFEHNLGPNPHLISSIKALIEITEDGNSDKHLRLIENSILELQQSFHVFNQHRDKRKVCIFGSARTPKDDKNYGMARDMASKLSKKGYMIITGAGDGIMGAGNEGAEPNMSFGLNIELPFEQEANPYIKGSDKLINFKYFFTRKLIFIKESDATIVFPGGFGTMDEAFELLTLIQTGRCSPRPVIFMSHKESHYWERWFENINKEMCGKGYISEEDLHFLNISHSKEEALKYIDSFYSIYHSIHYVDETCIIRLNKALSPETQHILSAEFKDMIKVGTLEQLSAKDLPEEAKRYPEKIFLRFEFEKKEFGNICKLITRFTALEA